MLISLQWLNQWLSIAPSTEQLESLLTFGGFEVESIQRNTTPLDRIIVGEITAITAHPQADRLRICQIDDGVQNLQVVCGASNARSGLKVALALPGARIQGKKLKSTKMRGVVSQGMLCSARELGRDDDHAGILELEAAAPLGEPIADWLAQTDVVLDLAITPNRGDCLSIRGIAREVAALQPDTHWNAPSASPMTATIEDYLPVQLQAPQACPLYAGCIIRGINMQASTPTWMRQRLEACGLRSIDPVVDITNYVMLESGQPLHAFDAARISTGITVRWAQQGERLSLLNGSEQTLSPDTLVIADSTRPLAIAGIMGGKDSAISAQTRNIFLEAAFFTPSAIAGKARCFHLTSDAAYRFERGVDPALPIQALEHASALLRQIVGGEYASIYAVSDEQYLPQRAEILLDLRRMQRRLGIHVDGTILCSDRIRQILENLGCEVQTGSLWRVKTPSHRFDLHIEEDLYEEIARVYGYAKIPEILPALPAIMPEPIEKSDERAQQILSQQGYQEAICYSLLDATSEAVGRPPMTQAITIRNPISQEMQIMRSSLLPGLLKTAACNLHRQKTAFRLFECGAVFWHDAHDDLQQRQHIAMIAVGNKLFPQDWQSASLDFTFYDFKADCETLCRDTDQWQWRALNTDYPLLHPGKRAQLIVAGQEAGRAGQLHPQMHASFDISADITVWLFECDPAVLAKNSARKQYRAFSYQPEIHRDLSLLAPEKMDYATLEKLIITAGGTFLRSLQLCDIYRGAQIPDGYYALTCQLIWQHPKKTLTDTAINRQVDQIINKLNALQIKLRT